LGTGHQRRQADQGQGWAGPEGRGLIAFIRRRKKTRVARWAAWAERAMKLVGRGGGLGGVGRPAGQGRVEVMAGPADMGRAEVADFLGVRIREGQAVFLEIHFLE
jgi:hypothetical protein